jgi:hypothetical protein
VKKLIAKFRTKGLPDYALWLALTVNRATGQYVTTVGQASGEIEEIQTVLEPEPIDISVNNDDNNITDSTEPPTYTKPDRVVLASTSSVNHGKVAVPLQRRAGIKFRINLRI